MNEFIQNIIDFSKKFFPNKTPTQPSMLDRETVEMRIKFLGEELIELADAFGYRVFISHENRPLRPEEKPLDKMHLVRVPSKKVDPEGVLDALVDLQYVLLGTANFLGFFKKYEGLERTLFESAWRRVHYANMRKERAERPTKRGTTFDVVKPKGWSPPYLNDLVRGFFGTCRDCGCVLTEEKGSDNSYKCAACDA